MCSESLLDVAVFSVWTCGAILGWCGFCSLRCLRFLHKVSRCSADQRLRHRRREGGATALCLEYCFIVVVCCFAYFPSQGRIRAWQLCMSRASRVDFETKGGDGMCEWRHPPTHDRIGRGRSVGLIPALGIDLLLSQCRTPVSTGAGPPRGSVDVARIGHPCVAFRAWRHLQAFPNAVCVAQTGANHVLMCSLAVSIRPGWHMQGCVFGGQQNLHRS